MLKLAGPTVAICEVSISVVRVLKRIRVDYTLALVRCALDFGEADLSKEPF